MSPTGKAVSKKPTSKAPLRPEDVRVVMVGNVILIYRDGSLIRETDSMGRPTGILAGQGLMGCQKESQNNALEWTPCRFQFRAEEAGETSLDVQIPYLSEWLLAGVVIGERTDRIKKREGHLRVEGGRDADQDYALEVWNSWIQWREEGSAIPFYQFMGVVNYDSSSADALRKSLKRMGLSTARGSGK
jgi:hypothetical protein